MSEETKIAGGTTAVEQLDFEPLVEQFYDGLFQFGLRRARNREDAADSTQQTFYLLQGHQLCDRSRIKSWLYTTLYNEFLQRRRHEKNFPKVEVGKVEHELPHRTVNHVRQLEASALLEELPHLELRYRAPLVLFYFKDLSYKEIAESLDMPIGTVMSRLSRAKLHLGQQLKRKVAPLASTGGTVARMPPTKRNVGESLDAWIERLVPLAA